MTSTEIIFSILGFVVSYFLKGVFKEALCEINSFGCFIGFLAYSPMIIVVLYWIIKDCQQ